MRIAIWVGVVVIILGLQGQSCQAQCRIETGTVWRQRYFPQTDKDTFAFVDVYWCKADEVEGKKPRTDTIVAINMLSKSKSLFQINADHITLIEGGRYNRYELSLGCNATEIVTDNHALKHSLLSFAIKGSMLSLTKWRDREGIESGSADRTTRLKSSGAPLNFIDYTRGVTITEEDSKWMIIRDTFSYFKLHSLGKDTAFEKRYRGNNLVGLLNLNREQLKIDSTLGKAALNCHGSQYEYPTFSDCGVLSWVSQRNDQFGDKYSIKRRLCDTYTKSMEELSEEEISMDEVPRIILNHYAPEFYPWSIHTMRKMAYDAMLKDLQIRGLDADSHSAVGDFAQFEMEGSWYVDDKGIGMLFTGSGGKLYGELTHGQLQWHLPWSEVLPYLRDESNLKKVAAAQQTPDVKPKNEPKTNGKPKKKATAKAKTKKK